MGRMSKPLESLASYPVMSSFTFLIRSPAVALTEVAIAFSRSDEERRLVRRFALWLAACSLLVLAFLLSTPLAQWWFTWVMGVPAHLTGMVVTSMWISLAAVVGGVFKNLFQGIGVAELRTGIVRNGTIWNMAGMGLILGVGVVMNGVTGLWVAAAATSGGVLLQLLYFYFALEKKR